MPPERGTIVCSAAGRDRGTFMIVMSSDEKSVVVCDGRERPLERQKRKNIKHISLTKAKVGEEQMRTNRSIRHALSDFRANNVKGEI